MIISHQPEERYFLRFKGKESCMDCSLCALPSRIVIQHKKSLANISSLVESTGPSSGHRRNMRNRQSKMSFHSKSPGSVASTIDIQLRSTIQNLHNSLSTSDVSNIRRKLCFQSTNDLPSDLSAFAGLYYETFNIYKAIQFDKLHALDLDIIVNSVTSFIP